MKYDGDVLALSKALHRFAHDRRDLADGRSLPRNDEGRGRPGVASRADFKTVAEKTAYIQKHGVDAFERLPATAPVTKEIQTRQDFFKLSTAEKPRTQDESRLLSEFVRSVMTRLQRRTVGQRALVFAS